MNRNKLNKFKELIENLTISDKRDNNETFYKFGKTISECEELKDLLFKCNFEIRDSHYNQLDNFKYMVLDNLNLIEENNFLEDENNAEAYFNILEDEILNDYCESDIYTNDLLKWFTESLDNIAFCDDAMKECSQYDNITELIGCGQYEFKKWFYYGVFKPVLEHIFNNLNEEV